MSAVFASLLMPALYALCLLALAGLAILIGRSNPRAALNRYFVLFALTAFGWVMTLYFFNRTGDTPFLTTLGRLNFACAAAFVLFYYLQLPEIARSRERSSGERLLLYSRSTLWLMAETGLLVALTLLTPLIDRAEHWQGGRHITEFGPLFWLYIAHLLAYILAALWQTFFAHRDVSRRVQGQLSVIGFGIVLMAIIAILTNIVLPFFFHVFALQEVGGLSILALLGTVAYAITAHRLFDIRVVIRGAVVFTALLALILLAYTVLIMVLRGWLLGTGEALSLQTDLANLLAIALIGFTVEPLRRWLTVKTDRFLFQREYNERELIAELTRQLNGVFNLDEALGLVMKVLAHNLHIRQAVVYVFQPGEGSEPALKTIRQIGHRHPAALQLEPSHPLLRAFRREEAIVLTRHLQTRLDELKGAAKREASLALSTQYQQKANQDLPEKAHSSREIAELEEVVDGLHLLRAAVAVPLVMDKRLLGIMFLGNKASGDPFTHNDVALLEAIGAQAISSIQKAKLYEDDQTKSTFVSMASHELLTPLTGIQGYLSMILDEGLGGQVDPQARGYLEKTYASTKRLINLVKDLLSVSRIEAGRMKFEPQQLDLEKLVEHAFDELRFVAQENGLSFIHEKSATPLPKAYADSDRTMEVLMNLIGNALKYTPSGEVRVRVLAERGGHRLRVEVQDTGLGMTREAQSHLFERFYRVATPQTTGIQGTGLGLYITKSLIEKMGGGIYVQSRPGVGSTFAFTLPVFAVGSATMKEKANEKNKESTPLKSIPENTKAATKAAPAP